MPTEARRSNNFLSYPTHRVVGTVADPNDARNAIDALVRAGFEQQDIDVLHGEEDLHRLDPTGADHGFLAKFQRTLIRIAGPVEEYEYLRHLVEDVRAGRFVIMVLAKDRPKRDAAADALHSHGADFIGFYGRWAYQAFDAFTAATGPDARETPIGQTYEVDLEGERTRVRFESESVATVSDVNDQSAKSVRATIIRIRPSVLMLSWQRPDGTAVVHVDDLWRGATHAVMTGRDGSMRRLKGTVRRVD